MYKHLHVYPHLYTSPQKLLYRHVNDHVYINTHWVFLLMYMYEHTYILKWGNQVKQSCMIEMKKNARVVIWGPGWRHLREAWERCEEWMTRNLVWSVKSARWMLQPTCTTNPCDSIVHGLANLLIVKSLIVVRPDCTCQCLLVCFLPFVVFFFSFM